MILTAFVGCVAVQCLFWGLWFYRAFRSGAPFHRFPFEGAAPVSVIVCFRNEAAHLPRAIAAILDQEDDAGFELILVDDNSTDSSGEIAAAFARRDDRVRLLRPGPTRPGKKDALAYGIAQARHELLLLTDADCTPAGVDWLATMAAPLRAGAAELVLGVSPVRVSAGGGLLARWQRYETLYVATKYLGFAAAGFPYMGVGRNLAYHKDFYHRAGGFTGHADLPGGDDDLLVSANAHPGNTVAVTAPAGWTFTEPQPTPGSYLRQRARHQSTGVRYPLRISLLLTLVAASHVGCYLFGLWSLLRGQWLPVLCLMAVRAGLQWAAYRPSNRAYAAEAHERATNWSLLPLFDLLTALMYGYLAVAAWVPARRW